MERIYRVRMGINSPTLVILRDDNNDYYLVLESYDGFRGKPISEALANCIMKEFNETIYHDFDTVYIDYEEDIKKFFWVY